jgi:hypothetical protein
MAPKRRVQKDNRSNIRSNLDMSNYMNWNRATLRSALEQAGIVVHDSYSLQTLRRLYQDNVAASGQTRPLSRPGRRPGALEGPTSARGCVNPGIDPERTHADFDLCLGQARIQGAASQNTGATSDGNFPDPVTRGTVSGQAGHGLEHGQAEAPTNSVHAPSTARSNTFAPAESDVNMANVAALSSLTQTLAGLQSVVANMMSTNQPASREEPRPTNNLARFYEANRSRQATPTSAPLFTSASNHVSNTTNWPTAAYTMPSTSSSSTSQACLGNAVSHDPAFRPRRFGISPEDLPHLDLMSAPLRRQIIEGKDVNLAALLIPYFESTDKEDTRLKRALTIQEFITAFGKYKRVMCEAYPERREELDAYEAIVVGLSSTYGPCFYEYHKLFSYQCAVALEIKGTKVDWSIRDRDLIQLVSTGSRCQACGEVSHATQFCSATGKDPDVNQNSAAAYHVRPNYANVGVRDKAPPTDRHGRPRVVYRGGEICNNFNAPEGCERPQCTLIHVCLGCKSRNHGASSCSPRTSKPKAKSANKPGKPPGGGAVAPSTTPATDSSQ